MADPYLSPLLGHLLHRGINTLFPRCSELDHGHVKRGVLDKTIKASVFQECATTLRLCTGRADGPHAATTDSYQHDCLVYGADSAVRLFRYLPTQSQEEMFEGLQSPTGEMYLLQPGLYRKR